MQGSLGVKMKFMKLGTKPDSFQLDGNSVRHVSSDLETDVIIRIGQIHFHLHKFPLLSKSYLLQKLITKPGEDKSSPVELHLPDFPGGPEAFEICAKFCYGIAVTLSAYNVVAARCAAEYLEMTEDVERGNLTFKLELFLNSSIFNCWKDSIIVLQTCVALFPWCEDLNIVGRCVESIASKAPMDPADVPWPYTHNRRLVAKVIDSSTRYENGAEDVPKDWWVEDVSDLEIDLYKRLVVALKLRVNSSVIGEALKVYAQKWLPESADKLASEDHMQHCKYILETIVWLLPTDKVASCECKFLLKLLKVAVVVGAEDLSIQVLVERISLKLDEASVKDLLIPARPPVSTSCDTMLVHSIVKNFVMNASSGFANGHQSLLRIGRLVDGYLAEIAHDPNLQVSDFVSLCRSVPDVARAMHDGLYMAIDIYLKEHPNLTKQERRRLCGAMDVKKLTMEASIHAAQNDRLPLRVIVQVLFFEQIRATAAGALSSNNSQCTAASIDEEHDNTSLKNHKLPGNKLIKVNTDSNDDHVESSRLSKSSRGSSNEQQVTSRSMRMLSKLWITARARQGDKRSSATSGSSLSPTSSSIPLAKSCNNPSAGCRRLSVS